LKDNNSLDLHNENNICLANIGTLTSGGRLTQASANSDACGDKVWKVAGNTASLVDCVTSR